MVTIIECDRCGSGEFGVEMRWIHEELKLVPVCKNCLKPIVKTGQKSMEEEK